MELSGKRLIPLVALVVLAVSACASQSPATKTTKTSAQVPPTYTETAESSIAPSTPEAVLSPTSAPTTTPAPTNTPTSTPTLADTATPRPSPTLTSTPTPVVSVIRGVLFHDLNGNGLQEEHELPLEGFQLCVDGTDTCAVTDSLGNYALELVGVPPGRSVQVKITDPDKDDRKRRMKYVNLWEAKVTRESYNVRDDVYGEIVVPKQILDDTKLLPIEMNFYLNAGTTQAIGLMQGAITLPFAEKELDNVYLVRGIDLFPGPGVMDHRGDSEECFTELGYCEGEHTKGDVTSQDGVVDTHSGLDFDFTVPLFVLAPVEGYLYPNCYYNEDTRECAAYFRPAGGRFEAGVQHLAVLLEKEHAYRGQIIGAIFPIWNRHFVKSPDYDGQGLAHIHLDLRKGESFPEYGYPSPTSKSIYEMIPEEFIVEGFNDDNQWTLWNQPQFPALGEDITGP